MTVAPDRKYRRIVELDYRGKHLHASFERLNNQRGNVVEVDPEVLSFVKDHRWLVLATEGKSGRPQQTMVSYAFDGESFFILAPGDTLKVRNIRRHPDVSLAIVDGREQVIAYGTARLIEDVDQVAEIVPRLRENPPENPSLEETRDWVKSGQRVIIVLTPASFYPRTMPR